MAIHIGYLTLSGDLYTAKGRDYTHTPFMGRGRRIYILVDF